MFPNWFIILPILRLISYHDYFLTNVLQDMKCGSKIKKRNGNCYVKEYLPETLRFINTLLCTLVHIFLYQIHINLSKIKKNSSLVLGSELKTFRE